MRLINAGVVVILCASVKVVFHSQAFLLKYIYIFGHALL